MHTRQDIIIAGLVGAAIAFILPHQLPSAHGQQAAAGGSEDMFAVVGPGAQPTSSVLYLVDPDSKRLLVYEYRAGGRLELAAARDVDLDSKLPFFPAQGNRVPTPTQQEVREAVKKIEDAANAQQPGGTPGG